MSPEPLLGLYVHVPFCSAICNYCNFNRGLFDESLKARFVAALIAEIVRGDGPEGLCHHSAGGQDSDRVAQGLSPGSLVAQGFSPVSADSLYFGGGTPSLLTPEEISRVIDAARSAYHLSADAEITLEANPESVDEARLDGFRRAGINRLSFGVQSFRDDELRLLDRLHTAARAEQAIGFARGAGFDNISLDLMMWLPDQTVARWMESVERAIALSPEHMSLYMLEVYPHLPLRQEMDRQKRRQEPDDVAADMYEQAMTRLESAGYRQYEISNVARPGRQSLHNLKYWSDGEWLGFGPGAHSTRHGCRWKNLSSTEDYVQRMARGAPVVAERRTLSSEERLGDALFTGLRLNDGVELSSLSGQYGIDIWRAYGERLAPYVDAGLLVKEGDRIRLSRPGMLMAHEVMAVFV